MENVLISVEQSIFDCLDKDGCACITVINSIELNEEDKWVKSSMICRLQYNIPSTTNLLESYQRHLNKYTQKKKKI